MITIMIRMNMIFDCAFQQLRFERANSFFRDKSEAG